jgi:arginine decarboxylase
MKISVVASVGEGTTLLSSFDAALNNAGVSNYNLIPLSSVIPPNAEVVPVENFLTPDSEWGHKLYVVKAEMRSQKSKKYIAAGVGWYQLEDGRGLFVEHECLENTKESVESELNFLIDNSLKDLCKHRNISFDPKKINKKLSITQVKDKPACALVLAVYQSEGWHK